MSRPTVVKVGGSLYDLPDLAGRLRSYLTSLAPPLLLFPGGGRTADVVRAFDDIHGLGEEAAHWLALRACSLNAHFLGRLLDVPISERLPTEATCAVVDAFAFAQTDESYADDWPHRWDVTSDSMAVRVAHRAGAAELILLKSVDWSAGQTWDQAAAVGVVDAFFPTALRRVCGLTVQVVNLRDSTASIVGGRCQAPG